MSITVTGGGVSLSAINNILGDNEELTFGDDGDIAESFDPSIGGSGAYKITDKINNEDRLEVRVGENTRIYNSSLEVAPADGPVAQSGAIRLENEDGITSRNAADTADVRIASVDSDDTVQIANLNDSGIRMGGSISIEDGGSLTVGDTSPESAINNAADTQIIGTGSDSASALIRFSNNGFGPYIQFGKSRGTTLGATGNAVTSGDRIGALEWYPDDGTDLQNRAARISSVVDGSVGTDAIPMRIVMETMTGGGALTEALRIDSSQDTLFNGNNLAQIGGSPDSTVGAIRTGRILDLLTSRNPTDTGNVRLIGQTASGAVDIGSNSVIGVIIRGGQLNMNEGYIANIGGTPDAASGDIRMANQTDITFRNNADGGDVRAIRVASDDTVQISTLNDSGVRIGGNLNLEGSAPGISWDSRINLTGQDGERMFRIDDRSGANRGWLAYVPPAGSDFTVDLENEEMTWRLDEANDDLEVVVQYSDGTQHTGSISLT